MRRCPKCGTELREQTFNTLLVDFSWARLTLFYDLCNMCKIVFLDKKKTSESIALHMSNKSKTRQKQAQKALVKKFSELYWIYKICRYSKAPAGKLVKK